MFLSLGPPPPQSVVRGFDKLGHVLAYFTLMMWFGALYRRWARFAYALGLLVLGAMLEWMQGATMLRTPDWADMLANTFGVLAGLALAYTRASRFLLVLERYLYSLVR